MEILLFTACQIKRGGGQGILKYMYFLTQCVWLVVNEQHTLGPKEVHNNMKHPYSDTRMSMTPRLHERYVSLELT